MVTFRKEAVNVPGYMGRGWHVLNGYASEHFHISNWKGFYYPWCVYHKPSKRNVSMLDQKTLKGAKDVVAAIEKQFKWGADSLEAIAHLNDMTPRQLYDALKEASLGLR